MSRDLLERAKAVVQAATKRGAHGVRASAYRRRESTVEWRDGKIDRLRESTSMGVSVSLYVDGRYSGNSTSDLRPEALERFIEETVAMTRLLAVDENRKLPDPARYRNRFTGELGKFDGQGAAQLTGAERRRVAQALEQAARQAKGSDKIISVTTTCSDSQGEQAMLSSNGLEASEQGTNFSLVAEVSVRDQGDRKPEGYHYSVCRKRSGLPPVEEIGREATRRALEMIGEKPGPSGQYPCVIENRVVGRLLYNLIDPLSGRNIQQQRSFLADKLGQAVGSKRLTIVDDPHAFEGLGSTAFDSEGMSTAKLALFEQGVLRNHLLDTYYASKLGRQPTFGSTTNLVIEPGDKALPGLLKAMGAGILITGFSGGNSNSATGDFSVGVRGLWIENGVATRPFSEMNLAGNHLKFWQMLAEAGADVHLHSSTRSPSLRFEPVQFSGA